MQLRGLKGFIFISADNGPSGFLRLLGFLGLLLGLSGFIGLQVQLAARDTV